MALPATTGSTKNPKTILSESSNASKNLYEICKTAVKKPSHSRLHSIASWLKSAGNSLSGFFSKAFCCIPKKSVVIDPPLSPKELKRLESISGTPTTTGVPSPTTITPPPSTATHIEEEETTPTSPIVQKFPPLGIESVSDPIEPNALNKAVKKRVKFSDNIEKNSPESSTKTRVFSNKTGNLQNVSTSQETNSISTESLKNEESRAIQYFRENLYRDAMQQIRLVKDRDAMQILKNYFSNLLDFQHVEALWRKRKVSSFVNITNGLFQLRSQFNRINTQYLENKHLLNNTDKAGEKIEEVLEKLEPMLKKDNLEFILKEYGNREEDLILEFTDAQKNLEVYEYDLECLGDYLEEKINQHFDGSRKESGNNEISKKFEEIYQAYSQVDLKTVFEEPMLVTLPPSHKP